jgi:ketosteroid isomerase-like protein
MKIHQVHQSVLGVALVIACGLSGCASAPPAPDADEFKQMFTQRYVAPFVKGDAAAWAAAFAPDAVGLHDRRPADVGQAAIAEFGKMVATHLKIDRFDVTVEQVRVNGSWAYTRGSYTTRLLMRSDGKDSGLGGEGKFFILWERQLDGQWKIIVDMGNRKS